MLISGASFAKLANCKRQNIYKLVREEKLIKHDSGKYDLTNEINQKYLLSKGLKISDIEQFVSQQTKKPKKTEKKSTKKPVKPEKKAVIPVKVETDILPKKEEFQTETGDAFPDLDNESFEDITGLPSKMMELTMFELVKKYGGMHRLEKWANVTAKFMTAQKNEVAIQKDRLKLIEKDFTISQVFKFVDEFINKIFDSIDSQNEIIYSLAKSEKSEAKLKIKKMMLDNYSKLAKDAKQIITNNLSKMKDKYSQGE
jgi:hypothetical protein